jgi:hypothetical protein
VDEEINHTAAEISQYTIVGEQDVYIYVCIYVFIYFSSICMHIYAYAFDTCMDIFMNTYIFVHIYMHIQWQQWNDVPRNGGTPTIKGD